MDRDKKFLGVRLLQSFHCHILGLTDVPGESTVKMYCSRCCDVFHPRLSRHQNTDGCYFGTGFPHMLFFVRPDLRPKKPKKIFTAKLVFWDL